MFRSALVVVVALQTLLAAAFPQPTAAPDTPEAGSIDAIAAATGDPRFMSPLVAYLPLVSGVPSPLAFFGRIMGAPGELADTAKASAYSRALAAG